MEQEALGVGDAAPEINLASTGHGAVSLKGLRGRKVLIAFYPRDDTPG